MQSPWHSIGCKQRRQPNRILKLCEIAQFIFLCEYLFCSLICTQFYPYSAYNYCSQSCKNTACFLTLAKAFCFDFSFLQFLSNFQSCPTTRINSIHIGPTTQKQLSYILIPHLSCHMQGCTTIPINSIHIRSRVQKQLSHIHIPVQSCVMQGCPTRRLINNIHIYF